MQSMRVGSKPLKSWSLSAGAPSDLFFHQSDNVAKATTKKIHACSYPTFHVSLVYQQSSDIFSLTTSNFRLPRFIPFQDARHKPRHTVQLRFINVNSFQTDGMCSSSANYRDGSNFTMLTNSINLPRFITNFFLRSTLKIPIMP